LFKQPYGLAQLYKIRLEELGAESNLFHLSDEAFLKYESIWLSTEDIENIMKPMALDSKEPVGSMGTDIPLLWSDQPQHLSYLNNYLHRHNPLIDLYGNGW
jgi:glutamate synthase (NADPH/NADH) large chain